MDYVEVQPFLLDLLVDEIHGLVDLELPAKQDADLVNLYYYSVAFFSFDWLSCRKRIGMQSGWFYRDFLTF